MDHGTTLIREVAISYRGARRQVAAPLRAPADAARFVRQVVAANNAREHFLAIFLDGRHRPIGYQVVSVGTATASLIHPREVFQPAIAVGAVATIVAHNHPSSDPSPSSEDHAVTKRLADAGHIVGIALLDHVVVTADGFHSFKEDSPALFERSAP